MCCDCKSLVLHNTKACALPKHQGIEWLHTEKGLSLFILKDHCDQHGVTHPINTIPDHPTQIAEDLNKHIEYIKYVDGQLTICNTRALGGDGVGDITTETDITAAPCQAVKSAAGNLKFKARFACRRTHNKQILVQPCGVIYAQVTFFGAEAVSNVLVRLFLEYLVPKFIKGSASYL
jgi:hypothetical protein